MNCTGDDFCGTSQKKKLDQARAEKQTREKENLPDGGVAMTLNLENLENPAAKIRYE